LLAAGATRSTLIFGVAVNLFWIVVFFFKPIAERLSIPAKLLSFPSTWMECAVIVLILAILNALLWPV
jgi:hypothetical protein